VFVAFLTLVCTLHQIVTDVHLFQEKKPQRHMENFYLFQEKKPQRHVENVIIMFNHAGFSDNSLLECVYSHRLLFFQCAIFMVDYTVT